MVEQVDRKYASAVLSDAAAAHNTAMPPPEPRPAKRWEPKPLSSIAGLPVFGPQSVPGGVFKGGK